MIGNLLYCLENGSQLGWFLDPSERSILVLLSDRPPLFMEGHHVPPTLTGINLDLTVEQIFGWLKMGD